MKVEKVQTSKNQYPKFEELNKKSTKTKIGIIAALAIAFKSKCISATPIPPPQIIPGNAPTHLEPEHNYIPLINSYIMLIISIIISIVVKIQWKNYNSKQKKIAKIILFILFLITIPLVLITTILIPLT